MRYEDTGERTYLVIDSDGKEVGRMYRMVYFVMPKPYRFWRVHMYTNDDTEDFERFEDAEEYIKGGGHAADAS